MGRGRGGASGKSKTSKKKGLSCPDGACYLSSDSESDCSDSDCSDCYDCGPRTSRRAQSKSKAKLKKAATGPKKTKKKKSKKKSARDSSSCSCSDCMDYSSDDSYNCPPARGRKCSTC